MRFSLILFWIVVRVSQNYLQTQQKDLTLTAVGGAQWLALHYNLRTIIYCPHKNRHPPIFGMSSTFASNFILKLRMIPSGELLSMTEESKVLTLLLSCALI